MTAQHTRYYPWSQVEIELLHDLYGKMLCRQVAQKLTQITGKPRNEAAVWKKAQEEGLSAYQAPGYFSVRDAALELGVSEKTIYSWIYDGRAGSRAAGRRILTVSAMENLRKLWPALPKRSTTRAEVARRLGVSDSHAGYLLRCGFIRGVVRGRRWHVDADHLDEVASAILREGVTRLSLPDCEASRRKHEANNRAKAKYRARIREERLKGAVNR